MQLLELHPHAQHIVAEVLLLIVDAVIAVEFIDDVMELCEHKAADVLVQAVFVEHIVVLPGQVTVAGAVLHAPDHTALGVHQRHVRRTVFPDEVPAAALMPALGGGIDVLLDGHVAVQIEVPGVDIRLHMVVVAGGVILHDARIVHFLDAAVHAAHPFLRIGRILPVMLAVRLVKQTPCLVEHDPGHDGRMVPIPADELIQLVLKLRTGFRQRLAPIADHVRKGEDAELIHPIKLARLFGLDVQAHKVQSHVLQALHLVDHVLLGGQGEITLRIEGLVQRAVEIDRLAV